MTSLRTPIRTRLGARELAQVAVFAALIAALGIPGAITIGTAGVPITFQTLGVMLADNIAVEFGNDLARGKIGFTHCFVTFWTALGAGR